MTHVFLKKKIEELCRSGATLLWLEGAKHESVVGIKLSGNRLALQLEGNITRMVSFDRYTATKVGLQFWNKGKPGVLYRWDQVPTGSTTLQSHQILKMSEPTSRTSQFDDDPPPNKAA